MNDFPAPAVLMRGVTRRFGGVTAVDAVTFEIPSGQVFGVLGHNGAGKTTTVRLLNGLLRPDAGTLRVLGLDPTVDGLLVRARSGVSTETPSVDDRLTGRQTLAYFADLYGLEARAAPARVDALLHEFDLHDAAGRLVGTYSKGMKQRLALARAFLHEPEVLFLDEPTSGLDPVAARAVNDRIRAAADGGVTVLLCTHNLAQAQELCDRVAVLERGRLVAIGAPGELALSVRAARLRLRVAAEDVERAAALLADSGAERNADVLRVPLAQHDDVPRYVARLALAGVRIYEATPETPSLEDIYFALHERNEAAA